jgi:tetratricopeptide (TPR) repeat protein
MAKPISKFKSKEVKKEGSVELYYNFLGWFEENKKLVYGGIAVFVVIIAAVVFYGINKKENNVAAGTALTKILPTYESGAYLQAIDGDPAKKMLGLKKIAEDFAGTENGEAAKIYVANALSYLGKSEEAFKYYDDYSGGNPIFKAAAEYGKAGYYEVKKELEKAVEGYEKAASLSKENPMNAQYLLNAAIVYIDMDKKEKAKDILITLKTEYSKSAVIKDVDRYMALVD